MEGVDDPNNCSGVSGANYFLSVARWFQKYVYFHPETWGNDPI